MTDAFRAPRTLAGPVVSFPHVVTAPPERVYDTLVNPAARTRHHKFFRVAEAEKGKAGEKGMVARFETKLLGKWREALAEHERPTRVVFEERAAAEAKDAKPLATLEWRLAPIKRGTHVVLEVKGSNLWNRFVSRYVKRYRYRAVVQALKKSVEGEPDSIVPDFPTIEEWNARRAAAEGGEAPAKKTKAKPAADEGAQESASPPKKLKTVKAGGPPAQDAPVATPPKPKPGKKGKK